MSRDPGANWQDLTLPIASFPYQERVLYNLQYPRVPAQPQPPFWSVADLGLQAQTSPGDTGIRPDDALFLNANNTSRSRNLLLFRHRAEALTRRLIRVELDLPRPGASVTVQILTSATDQTVLRTQQLGVRPAGWTTGFVSLPFDIATGNAYRIRAEIGDPNDPVNYYEGQYVQTLTIPANVPPTPAETSPVYLPVMSAPPPPEGENVLRNGSFTAEVAGTTLPDFWEVQGMFSPGVNIDDKISVIDFPAAPQKGLQLVAAPQSRAEILQRFHVSSPGNYRLTYTLRVNNVPNNLNTQLFVRLRNLTGGDWRVLERHTNSANGTTTTYTEDITVNEPGLISFQASFGADAGTATFTLSNISIRRLSGTSTMQGESVVQTNVQTIPPQNDDPTPTPTENPYPGPATPTRQKIPILARRPQPRRIPHRRHPRPIRFRRCSQRRHRRSNFRSRSVVPPRLEPSPSLRQVVSSLCLTKRISGKQANGMISHQANRP